MNSSNNTPQQKKKKLKEEMFWRVSKINLPSRILQFKGQTTQEKQAQSDHHKEQDLHTKACLANKEAQVQSRHQTNQVLTNQEEFG